MRAYSFSARQIGRGTGGNNGKCGRGLESEMRSSKEKKERKEGRKREGGKEKGEEERKESSSLNLINNLTYEIMTPFLIHSSYFLTFRASVLDGG